MKGNEVEQPARCGQGKRIKLRRHDQKEFTLDAVCGKIYRCEYCMNAWRKRIRRRIREGVDEIPSVRWKFVTLTFAREVSVEQAAQAWQRTRKRWWKEWGRPPFYRVWETTKRGRPHLHIVILANMEVVRSIGKRETRKNWVADMSLAGGKEQEKLMAEGWGEIFSIETAKGRGRAAGVYLSGYLGKASGKRLHRRNGRYIRIAEGSRNWGLRLPDRRYQYSKVDSLGNHVGTIDNMVTPAEKAWDDRAAIRHWEGEIHGVDRNGGLVGGTPANEQLRKTYWLQNGSWPYPDAASAKARTEFKAMEPCEKSFRHLHEVEERLETIEAYRKCQRDYQRVLERIRRAVTEDEELAQSKDYATAKTALTIIEGNIKQFFDGPLTYLLYYWTSCAPAQ